MIVWRNCLARSGAIPGLALSGGRSKKAAVAKALREFVARRSQRRLLDVLGTIDALLAQLCIRHWMVMLTTDNDFMRIADVAPLDVWR